jgi:hypothetical protein
MRPLLAQAPTVHPTWANFGPTEWIAVVVAGVIAVWCVWKAVMYTLRPGETEPDHIKRRILEEPAALRVSVAAPGEDADAAEASRR